MDRQGKHGRMFLRTNISRLSKDSSYGVFNCQWGPSSVCSFACLFVFFFLLFRDKSGLSFLFLKSVSLVSLKLCMKIMKVYLSVQSPSRYVTSLYVFLLQSNDTKLHLEGRTNANTGTLDFKTNVSKMETPKLQVLQNSTGNDEHFSSNGSSARSPTAS